MSYISYLLQNDLATLERYLEDARKELYFCRVSGDEDEITEARKHVDEIRTAISLKGAGNNE